MIKYETNKGQTKYEIEGDGYEIIMDALGLINLIYNRYTTDDTEYGEIFKRYIQDSVVDGSPVWEIYNESEVKN